MLDNFEVGEQNEL